MTPKVSSAFQFLLGLNIRIPAGLAWRRYYLDLCIGVWRRLDDFTVAYTRRLDYAFVLVELLAQGIFILALIFFLLLIFICVSRVLRICLEDRISS